MPQKQHAFVIYAGQIDILGLEDAGFRVWLF